MNRPLVVAALSWIAVCVVWAPRQAPASPRPQILADANAAASDVARMRTAAEQGDATAQYNLGRAYFAGQGIQRDYAEALKWFRRAADQGLAAAQYSLGEMYGGVPPGENERQYRAIVEVDGLEAFLWYVKAAEQGHADAQFKVGVLYYSGSSDDRGLTNVKRSADQAAVWFRRAADQGDERAMRFLGSMYADGVGVRRDDIEAYKWEYLADLRGPRRPYDDLRGKLAKRMTRQQIAGAERRALEWLDAFEKAQKNN